MRWIRLAAFTAMLPLLTSTPALAAKTDIRLQILPLDCVYEILNDGLNTIVYLTPETCNVTPLPENPNITPTPLPNTTSQYGRLVINNSNVDDNTDMVSSIIDIEKVGNYLSITERLYSELWSEKFYKIVVPFILLSSNITTAIVSLMLMILLSIFVA